MHDLDYVRNVAEELVKRGIDALDILLSALERENPHEAISIRATQCRLQRRCIRLPRRL